MAQFGSPFKQNAPTQTPETQQQEGQPSQQQQPIFTPTSQYSEYNTLSGRLPPPHKPAVNLTTTTPNVKTPPCTAGFGQCACPQSVAWRYDYRNCPSSLFPLPQNCEIRPYPPNIMVYDLNQGIYERSRVNNSNWNPYHFWNNQQGMYSFLASNLNLNNDPNLKPMDLNRPLTQYCFGCQGRVQGQAPIAPPRYLSF
jgi:hypothetical protein